VIAKSSTVSNILQKPISNVFGGTLNLAQSFFRAVGTQPYKHIEWTPHSADLNHLYYSIWDSLHQLTCERWRGILSTV